MSTLPAAYPEAQPGRDFNLWERSRTLNQIIDKLQNEVYKVQLWERLHG